MQEQQDRDDLIESIFNGDGPAAEDTIPKELDAQGDPVHIPGWIRNAADPLGLGLLPTDD